MYQPALSRGVLVAALLAVAIAPARPALAGSASATFQVSVTVQARALLTVEAAPASLLLTETDVRRGYVDLPAASRISVRTNSPTGYLLAFEIAIGPIEDVRLLGLGAETHIGGAGGWIAQPYSGPVASAELSYRLVLSKDARPGEYPWPVALSASPR
jgi:hypothetical protein